MSFLRKSTRDYQPCDYLGTEHLRDGLKGRTVRGGAVTLSAQLIKLVLMLTSTAILARQLTPQDFGLLSMVTVITGFVGLFSDLGLSAATIQQEEINHQQVSALFWFNSLLGILVMLLTFACAPLVAWFYQEPRLLPITMALGSTFLISGLSVQHKALLKRQMLFVQLTVIEIASISIGIIVAIVAAFYGARYWALVFQQLGIQITATLLVWILCGWRPGFVFWDKGLPKLLAFGRNLSGFNIFNYFSRNADNFLIGRYWGASQLGLYSKAYQLLLFPLHQINAPVSAVAIPALSRLANDPQKYRRTYLKIIENIAMLTMPMVAFMIATSDWIIQIILGEEWLGASPIFAWLGVAALVQPISNTVGWLFITQDRTDDMLRWGVIGGCITVLSFIIGLPFGTIGIAILYATSGIFIRAPLLYWFAGRSGSVKMIDFYRAIGYPCMLSLVILILLFAAKETVFTFHNPLVGLAAAGMTSFIAAMFLFFLNPKIRESIMENVRILKFIKFNS